MSYAQAKLDIDGAVVAVVAAWTAYTLLVETDNRNNIDYSSQQNPFLQVDTRYTSGEQLDMADVPKKVQYGQIILSAVAKVGTGATAGATLLDFVAPYFELKDFVCVRTKAAERQPDKPINGWCYMPLLINFWFIR